MNKFEKFLNNYFKAIKYIGIICIGIAIALTVEFGICFDFVLLTILSIILIIISTYKANKEKATT